MLLPDIILNLSFDQLICLIQSGIWTNRPDIAKLIYDQLLDVAPNGACLNMFPDDFWDTLGIRDILFDSQELQDAVQPSQPVPEPFPHHDEDSDDDDDEGGDDETFQEGGALDAINFDRHIELSEVYKQEVKRLKTTGQMLNLRFKDLDSVNDIQELARHAFQKVIDRTFAEGDEGDRVGLEIDGPGLKTPILIPVRERKRLNVDEIFRVIERVTQSKKGFQLDQDTEVKILRVGPPKGNGAKRHIRTNFEEWLEERSQGGGKRSCFIKIPGGDGICLPRAIVTAKARYERNDSDEKKRIWESVRKGDSNRYTKQKQLALELIKNAGLEGHTGAWGIPELTKFQTLLPDFQIKVWSKDAQFGKIFDGPARDKVLQLFHYSNHFIVISSISSFHERSYWCDRCDKGYEHRKEHRCEGKCRFCLNSPPCEGDQRIQCDDCKRYFISQDCFDRHKAEFSNGPKRQKITPICQLVKFCSQCDRSVSKGHICGEVYCPTCKKSVVQENHQCFMQKLKDPKKRKKARFLFFDFESSVAKEIYENEYGSVLKHEPNCCVSLKVCEDCYKTPKAPCEICGPEKRKEFLGPNTQNEFCKYLFSPQHDGITAIAHCMKSYDGQFLVQYLHEQGIMPEIIPRGMQIMELRVQGIRVIDSYCFLPMKLADFGKAFNLPMEKGSFPHLFNRPENWEYCGPLPDKSEWDPASMKEKDRDEFFLSHRAKEEQMKETGELFHFQKELVKYCGLDVDVMAAGVMIFREDFLAETGIDPFIDAVTIASACNMAFRRNHLQEDKIGIIPAGGYRKNEKQSVMAIRYLKWYAEKNDLASKGQRIQHARNGKEVKIGKYKVDGLLQKEDGTDLKKALEVNGCAWHGCVDCFKNRDKLMPNGLTAAEAYEQTEHRQRYLEQQGYEIEVIWECQIHAKMQIDPEMEEFFNNCEEKDPMDPSKALFGGRTNAIKLYHKCIPGTKIKYLDVCSLYPYVNKYAKYPVGHPIVITENFKKMTKDERPYEGIIYCKILPPRKLYHPVLPWKSNDKLTFPLCAACATERNIDICQHSNEERALVGVWVSDEVYKALEKGYEIMEIYEVYHFNEVAQYDGKDPKTGLLTEYINKFLKVKVENSGYPSHAKTPEEKDDYIKEFLEREGVILDPAKIRKNNASRQLGKLCLNSFWGKFAQRPDLPKKKYFTEPEEYFALVCDDTVEIASIDIVANNMVMVTYKESEDFVQTLGNVNPILAAYTTCAARLVLFSYLEKLDTRVLCFDTDSVIFTSAPGDTYEPPVGSFLGELTDELADYGEGSYIKEFVSTGPKSYACRIFTPGKDGYSYIVKIRGFTLNSTSGKRLNFKSLKRVVKKYLKNREKEEIRIVFPRIDRDRNRQLVTKTMAKVFRLVYDKRKLCDNGMTLPYGY